MRSISVGAVIAVAAVAMARAQSPPPPPWAYTVNPPPSASARETSGELRRDPDPAPQTLPGSSVSLTSAQTRDAFNPPDWHPDGHPPMPASVAHGRRPEMRACGFCHLVNGQGRPENASLAGLPAAYIIQQMADFRNGDRKSAEPRMGPPNAMIQDAKAAHDDDITSAAAYFSSFPYRKWVRVVESKDVPRSRIAGSMHVPTNDGTEPLGQRIIEMPEDLRRTELRDASSGFVAYVPVGSIAKGEALVKGGGGENGGVWHVPRRRSQGPRPGPAARGPIAKLHRATDVRLAAGRSQRTVVGADESGRCDAHHRRHDCHCGLYSLP